MYWGKNYYAAIREYLNIFPAFRWSHDEKGLRYGENDSDMLKFDKSGEYIILLKMTIEDTHSNKIVYLLFDASTKLYFNISIQFIICLIKHSPLHQ